MRAGWVVDVAAEEVVDRDVPFAGKFEPVLKLTNFLFEFDKVGEVR